MTQNLIPAIDAFTAFTDRYADLFHDKRLHKGFQACITGILTSGTTRLSRIARAAPQTGLAPHSERRFRRMMHNQNKRSDLNAEKISKKILEQGAKRLRNCDEVKVILDGSGPSPTGAGVGPRSDLRKPYSTSLEHLSTVRDLNGHPIPGYPTLNAIGINPAGQQTLLYHKTYSPLKTDFKSERDEVRTAIQTITTALRAQGVGRIIWILDRGFDGGQARQVLPSGQEIVKSSIGFLKPKPALSSEHNMIAWSAPNLAGQHKNCSKSLGPNQSLERSA